MCAQCKEAYDLLEGAFGEERAEFFLWNATCYPMDGETALRQAKELVEHYEVWGNLKELYEFADDPCAGPLGPTFNGVGVA